MAVLLGALGFQVWVSSTRARRVEFVSGQENWSVDLPTPEATSPTGYNGGQRRLIVPEGNKNSFEWIAQTQQMLATGQWGVRRVDYDNAPFGRETHLPAPYRWWLGLVAWLDHVCTGVPLGAAVERAALWADPLIQGLLLVGTAGFVAWRFGLAAAALLSVAVVGLFPFAADFLPGMPEGAGLARVCALLNVLLLLARTLAQSAGRGARIGFFVAGLAGGLNAWIDPAGGATILVGVLLGGLMAAYFTAPSETRPLPWRTWALGGAVICGLAGLVEYSPDDAQWQRLLIYPSLGLGWIIAGELLARAASWSNRRFILITIVAAIAVATVVFAARGTNWSWGPVASDPLAQRLTGLAGGANASSTGAWISRDGFSGQVWAALLPLLLVPVGIMVLWRRRTDPAIRDSTTLALGPLVVALAFACVQLRWWNTFDALLLPLLVAVAVALRDAAGRRSLWFGAVALAVIAGVPQLLPTREGGFDRALGESEVVAVVERDLAHWLASRSAQAHPVVFAAPDVTASLCFHGGLRGIWALSWENQQGLAAATRIASATSQAEALALLQQREVAYVVVPSWDSFLDNYALLGRGAAEASGGTDKSFIGSLHRWEIPAWLRPVPYYLPQIAGFENQSVTVFEVVDEQGPADQAGRMAEYFVDTGQIDLATDYRQNLRRFPNDAGALAALALVEAARGDADGFSRALGALGAGLERHSDRNLPWDRRISVAAVLVQGKQIDRAREQVTRCLAEIDETRVRSLSTSALVRLNAMARILHLEITDLHVRQLVIQLTPPKLRMRM